MTYVTQGWPIMVQVDVPVEGRADWQNYSLPPVDTPYRTSMLESAVRANTANLALVACFLGPLTMMYRYLMDLGTLSLTLYDDPLLVHEMCASYVDWTRQAVRLALDSGGIDAFCIADDWGATSGLLLSPCAPAEVFRQAVYGDRRVDEEDRVAGHDA